MPISDNYTQRLGLAELDVYLDTPDNDNTYFNIINLPQTAGYGKPVSYTHLRAHETPEHLVLPLRD